MKQQEEIWKPVAGYEGLYEVSNLGRIKSLTRKIRARDGYYIRGERMIKPCNGRNGYQIFSLHKNGKRTPAKVHRIVAKAFIPNPLNLPQINHKDENVKNNSVDNLEWCDQSYNSNYGNRSKRVSDALMCRKDTSHPIIAISIVTHKVKLYGSVRDAHRNGYDRSAVQMCCKNKYYKNKNLYKGFRWYFKERWDALTPEEQERLINS